MHQSGISQCTIQNRNVYIFVLNGTLWNMDRCIVGFMNKFHWNRPNSQIAQCTNPISHNAPFRTEMCIFCPEWYIVVYGIGALRDLRISSIAMTLYYKHAKKTEANQNGTDDGTHPPGTLCSLEEIGPVNKFIIIWLCQPKAGCTSKALTNTINSLAPTEIMS